MKNKLCWTSVIQTKMKEKGWRVADLSLASGVNVNTLNNVIYGETKDPSMPKMFAIAKALGCTIDELIDPNYVPANQVCSDAEVAILSNYRRLDEQGQKKAAEHIEDLVLTGKYKKAYSPGLSEKIA
ncbi:MAG: helix-turn-helix transcriptional regulator [Clostridiales bacterium]|nr:helix-turn-helix transcriptional regulator [Clostridiales bacterium]